MTGTGPGLCTLTSGERALNASSPPRLFRVPSFLFSHLHSTFLGIVVLDKSFTHTAGTTTVEHNILFQGLKVSELCDLEQPVGTCGRLRACMMLIYPLRLSGDMCHLSFLSRKFLGDDWMTIELSVSFEPRRHSFVLPSLMVFELSTAACASWLTSKPFLMTNDLQPAKILFSYASSSLLRHLSMMDG
jgi:hypothetical protein